MDTANETTDAQAGRVTRRRFLQQSALGVAGVTAVGSRFEDDRRSGEDAPLRAATFEVDATPSPGQPIAYGTAKEILHPLSCRGVILLPGTAPPIVLAAVDWIGNYNDGSPENRPVLAQRLADGMAAAWSATTKTPITGADVGWRVRPVALPLAPHLDEAQLIEALRDDPSFTTGFDLAWTHRRHAGDLTKLTCLALGPARVLHMPGELFVEYQLAAQTMRPDGFVAMAAYGDGGPGYIGTRAAYPKGGYEVSERASNVAPEVEEVLVSAMRELLGVPGDEAIKTPSAFTAQKTLFSDPTR